MARVFSFIETKNHNKHHEGANLTLHGKIFNQSKSCIIHNSQTIFWHLKQPDNLISNHHTDQMRWLKIDKSNYRPIVHYIVACIE